MMIRALAGDCGLARSCPRTPGHDMIIVSDRKCMPRARTKLRRADSEIGSPFIYAFDHATASLDHGENHG